MTIRVTCSCGKSLRTSDAAAGKRARCPECGATIVVPALVPVPAVEAPPPVLQRQAAVPVGKPTEPDDSATDGEEAYEGNGVRQDHVAPADLSTAYTIDLGLWFRTANQHNGAVFGPMIGYLFIFMGIVLVLELLTLIVIGYLGILLLVPPLAVGPTIVCLAQLKGRRWAFGDFFSGFRRYGAWLGVELLCGLLPWLVLLPALLVVIGVAAVVSAIGVDPDSPIMGVVGFINLFILLVGFLAGFYVWFRTSIFARQLMIDRGYGPIDAMKGCWQLTRGHFWGLCGVYLLMMLIILGSAVLTCGIASIFAAPYVLLVLTSGYLHIAGTRAPVTAPVRARD